MSDVLNPKLTGLTGFMFKQKQRANSVNTHKHLCGHTLYACIGKCTDDSMVLYLLLYNVPILSHVTFTFLVP